MNTIAGRAGPGPTDQRQDFLSYFEGVENMPEKEVIQRARQDAEQGKSPSTQAGEFVREEMRHIREGKHGAQSTQQAVAIGLSKARRAGVKLPAPNKGKVSSRARVQAKRDLQRGRHPNRKLSRVRSRAIVAALKREGRAPASRMNLSRYARTTAKRRGRQSRRESTMKAIRTKGKAGLRRAARKAARTRRVA